MVMGINSESFIHCLLKQLKPFITDLESKKNKKLHTVLILSDSLHSQYHPSVQMWAGAWR